MTTPLIINRLVAAFSSNNLSTSCVLPIQNLSRNFTEVDNMIDVVYEDETDDEAIYNRNGLVCDYITFTFGAEYA